MAFAGVFAAREHQWLMRADIVEGTVVEMIRKSDSDGSTYAPRVTFTARDGVGHTFTSTMASSPPGFRVNQTVAVAYDASRQGRIVTFGQRFGAWVIVGTIGVAAFLVGIAFYFGKLAVPLIYLKK